MFGLLCTSLHDLPYLSIFSLSYTATGRKERNGCPTRNECLRFISLGPTMSVTSCTLAFSFLALYLIG